VADFEHVTKSFHHRDHVKGTKIASGSYILMYGKLYNLCNINGAKVVCWKSYTQKTTLDEGEMNDPDI
jgi:hypothetical protein